LHSDLVGFRQDAVHSGQSNGRPRALDESKAALAQRMNTSGESASTIAATLGISQATVYRVLGARDTSG
jgi:DNA invertase Pin-like site-specific DNA recombinase